LFALIANYLRENGLKMSTGDDSGCNNHWRAVLDQEQKEEAGPDMKRTKKGNQWYFGMKVHIGVNSRTRLIYSAVATAAKVHDSRILSE